MLIIRPITMKVKVSTKINSRSTTIGSPQIMKTNQPRQKQHHVKRPQEDRGKLVSSATVPWNSNDGRFIRPLRLFSQLFLDFSCTRSSMSLRLSSSFVSFIHLTISLENRQSNCSKRFTKDNLQKRRKKKMTTTDANFTTIHTNILTAFTSVSALLVKDCRRNDVAQLVPIVEKCFT